MAVIRLCYILIYFLTRVITTNSRRTQELLRIDLIFLLNSIKPDPNFKKTKETKVINPFRPEKVFSQDNNFTEVNEVPIHIQYFISTYLDFFKA